MLERIPDILLVLATAAGAFITALYLGMVFWTLRDIHARSRDILVQIVATLMVAVLTIPGFIVYLILRPRETLGEAYERSLEQEALLQAIEEPEVCPGCGQRVRGDFVVCPICHTQLKKSCSNCGKALDLRWAICPFCTSVQTDGTVALERVEQQALPESVPSEA